MRASTFVVAAAIIVLTGCGVETKHIQSSIEDVIESDDPYAAGGSDVYREQVAEYYRQRDFQPSWVGSSRAREKLAGVLEILCRSDREGLNPADYANAELQELLRIAYEKAPDDSVKARRLSRLDVAVTHTLMDYASDVLTGRVDPSSFGSGWHTPVHTVDLLGVVSDTMTVESLRHLSSRTAERHEEYGELRQALDMYRRIAQQGGWPTVPAGEALEEGDSGERVKALMERLAAVGDVDSTLLADSTYQYTSQVAEAIRVVQRRFGLEPDGIAGENLITALNVPAEERARQIELNLERWRWIPSHLGSRYLYVNVPAFELHAFDQGEEVLSMAVVVGEVYEDNATPVFSDTMEYVVFNPYWNVPESIAKDEILPEARRDRSYLVRNDYEVVAGWSDDAQVLNPMTANLERVEQGTYRIRQKPGSQNALGRIKFMFPNQFNIYLHDTPADYLFERADRAYSHGCIRVEKPVDLASYVFTGDEWTRERIQERIESRERAIESLSEPLPVYILYWTAFVDGEGRVNFRRDLYGNDAALSEALAEQSRSTRRVPCESLVSLIKS